MQKLEYIVCSLNRVSKIPSTNHSHANMFDSKQQAGCFVQWWSQQEWKVNLWLALLTYACMYRGSPLWRCPRDRAFQLGLGEGPIGLVGPISQPRGTIDTASRTLGHTNAPTLL